MSDPRLTEERLRSWLDTNQPKRELLCLALLPLLGPFTQEQPRRPKGGADEGRDIEAIYDGSLVVFGAVGFKNGGGNDDGTRKEIVTKFDLDLASALKGKPDLKAFVFFTNVDLTLGMKEQMARHAQSQGLTMVEVFDMERLRHVLDSPRGLIPRLQYLDIEMSKTEQLALVAEMGDKLQSAMLSRFDRVEQTLTKMERFLDFQKAVYRIDIFAILNDGDVVSYSLENEAVLIKLTHLQAIDEEFWMLCQNVSNHERSSKAILVRPVCWSSPKKFAELTPSEYRGQFAAHFQLRLTHKLKDVTVANVDQVELDVFITERLKSYVVGLRIDVNGYEWFDLKLTPGTPCNEAKPEIPDGILAPEKWFQIAEEKTRDFIFDPPPRSPRFYPLRRLG
jgi:hypothetical protein